MLLISRIALITTTVLTAAFLSACAGLPGMGVANTSVPVTSNSASAAASLTQANTALYTANNAELAYSQLSVLTHGL